MKKKRCLVLLPGAFGPTGGIEAYSRLVIKSFSDLASELGYVADVFVLLDTSQQIKPHYFDAQNLTLFCSAGSRQRFVLQSLALAVRQRVDLLVIGHVNFLPLLWPFKMANLRARSWLLTYGVEAWSALPVMRRKAAQTMHRILAISDYTRREFARTNQIPLERIDLLPCALDPFWSQKFQPPATVALSQRPTLLTVARLDAAERYKGVDQVIRAMPAILKAVPNARYVIIGDGSARAQLTELVQTLGLNTAVEFRGRVSDADLAKAYEETWLFVMPSLREGFGIVYLEAAHFGKPSLAGNHGGSPEVVLQNKTGKLARHDDIEGIANQAIELLKNPTEVLRLGQAAHVHLQNTFTYTHLKNTLRSYVAQDLGT